MAGEVVALRGGPITGEPNLDVIQKLEDALERARRGEIVAVAIAAVDPGHGTTSSWDFGISGFSLLGAVRVLEHRVMQSLLGNA